MARSVGYLWLERLFWRRPAPRRLVVLQTATRMVDIPGHGRMLAHVCLDFSGQTCLRTNLGTQRVLEALVDGQVVEIVSDNLSAVETIPFMLDAQGFEHLGTTRHGGQWRVYARRPATLP